MTQATHTISIRSQVRAHRIAAVAALLALLATAALVLVLALDGGASGTTSSAADNPQAAVRSDSGPDESAVAGSIQPRVSNGPQESRVAAAVGSSAPGPAAGPDESSTAASIAGH